MDGQFCIFDYSALRSIKSNIPSQCVVKIAVIVCNLKSLTSTRLHKINDTVFKFYNFIARLKTFVIFLKPEVPDLLAVKKNIWHAWGMQYIPKMSTQILLRHLGYHKLNSTNLKFFCSVIRYATWSIFTTF